jgi:hypothetical protein
VISSHQLRREVAILITTAIIRRFRSKEAQPCVDCAAAPAVVNRQAAKKRGIFLYLAGPTALVGPSAVQRTVNKSRLSLLCCNRPCPPPVKLLYFLCFSHGIFRQYQQGLLSSRLSSQLTLSLIHLLRPPPSARPSRSTAGSRHIVPGTR